MIENCKMAGYTDDCVLEKRQARCNSNNDCFTGDGEESYRGNIKG